jgi:uncharacterized protein YndB with AHSA1/START domain
MTRWVRSVERRIGASPQVLYGLVSDPDRHREFDGSGGLVTRTEASTSERPLHEGDWFSFDMNLRGRYAMTSTVIEAEPFRRFAWQARPHRDVRGWRRMFGGRIWRYEFEDLGDGSTLVRESWDLSEEPLRFLMMPGGKAAMRVMDRSLALLSEVV